jgi:predicted MFS family arabinose efflux permease
MGPSPTPSSRPLPPAAHLSATATPSWRQQLLNPRILVLLAVVFSIDCMTGLVVIAFANSYLIETRHAPASYPAYALGIYGFVKLVAAPVGGWILDRVRAGTVVGFVCTVELLGLAVILLTETANGFLAGVGFLSTGIAVAWLLVFHALGDASDADVRASATAYVGLTSAAATATGFGIAAIVGETNYWRIAFFIALGLASVSSILLWRLYPAGHRIGSSVPVAEIATTPVDRRRQLIAGAVIFGHFVAVTATIAVFGPFVVRTLDLSLLHAGVLLLPAGGVAAGAMFVAGRISKPDNRLREVAMLYAVGAIAVLFAAGVHSPWVFALVAIPLALSIGGSQPLLNASLLDVSHSADRTGTVLGWLFFAEGLGSVVGPMVIAEMIDVSGTVRAGVVLLSILDGGMVILALAGSRLTKL